MQQGAELARSWGSGDPGALPLHGMLLAEAQCTLEAAGWGRTDAVPVAAGGGRLGDGRSPRGPGPPGSLASPGRTLGTGV